MQEDISIFPDRPIIYGTFWQRFAAVFIDGLVMMIPNYVIGLALGGGNWVAELIYSGHISSSAIWTNVAQTAASVLYHGVMESGKGQATVGKMAMKLKVTDVDGNRLSLGHALGRNLGKTISTLVIFIGYLMVLWDRRKQALHDKMAGTLVVRQTE